MGFDSRKLRKTMTAGHGAILVPLIESYQRSAKFPETWTIEIRNSKPDDGHFHPSSDAFTSPHDLWLAKQGRLARSPISPALRRTFDCGHMWHGYLQNILIEMGLVKPENVEKYIVKPVTTHRGEFIGAGTGDLIDVQIPGYGSWLVDIKTMNKPEFEQGANEYTMVKWRAQVSCYMDWFGADKAMILAICKDSPHDMREYQIIKDQSMLDEIYDRWSFVAECLRTNTDPDECEYKYEVNPILLNPGDSVLDVEIAKKGSTVEDSTAR